MGIIQKQTIKGTLYAYIGVIIGFVTAGILFPRFLNPEEIGLLNLLVAFSAIFAQLASLGMNSVTTRYFSYFRNKEQNHFGYLFILILVTAIGFLISLLIFLVLKTSLVENNIEKSSLFVKYINYIIPLTFFTLFFSVFDNYNKVLFNAVYGIYLKEFFQRILILISILLLIFKLITFHQFVFLYVLSLCLPTINLVIHLIRKQEFSIVKDTSILKKPMIKSMASVATFGIVGGFSTIAISYIDKIMINSMLDLSNTGIYATAAFFGIVILIPSRTLIKISSVIIADAWKEKNIPVIKDIYYKSCINQFVIALLIFIGIWTNIDSVFEIITKEFISGKYVIFFICITNIIDMGTGVNSVVISTSRYYYWQSYFIIFLAVLVVVSNYFFIPIWGITGAAIATMISGSIYNFCRYLFLYIKFKFQPFNYKFVLVILIGIASYYASKQLPIFSNVIFDLVLRSGIVVLVYLPLIYILKISEDINNKLDDMVSKTIRKKPDKN